MITQWVDEGPGTWPRTPVTTPQDLIAIADRELGTWPTERMLLILFDSGGCAFGVAVLGEGGLLGGTVSLEKAARTILAAIARIAPVAVALAHNHPSGARLRFSMHDHQVTRTVRHLCRLLGVGFVDHVLVGPGQPGISWYLRHGAGRARPITRGCGTYRLKQWPSWAVSSPSGLQLDLPWGNTDEGAAPGRQPHRRRRTRRPQQQQTTLPQQEV